MPPNAPRPFEGISKMTDEDIINEAGLILFEHDHKLRREYLDTLEKRIDDAVDDAFEDKGDGEW